MGLEKKEFCVRTQGRENPRYLETDRIIEKYFEREVGKKREKLRFEKIRSY